MFRLFKLLEPIFIFVVWSFGVYLALFRPFSVLILILAVFFLPRFTLIPCLLGFSFGVLTIPKFEVSSKRYVGRLEGILISDPKSVRKGLLSAYANTNRGAKYIKIPVLGWKGVDYLEEGAKIFGFATCVPLKPTYNPFTFNFQLTLKGVKEVCKFKNFSIVRNSKSTFKQLKINSDRKLESIKNYFGVKNLVLSFSLGRTLDLSLHHDKIFRDSGLYHLLVISGYQLMIIVTLVSRFVNFFRYKMNLFCLKSMICLKVI
ncbi:MAG: ComEC/Rec2 family competence protein [Deltaproteobacteria bacterium]|nr:ComEC/Rec2 family competence protein [Deltaproteobacteria bacterium]